LLIKDHFNFSWPAGKESNIYWCYRSWSSG